MREAQFKETKGYVLEKLGDLDDNYIKETIVNELKKLNGKFELYDCEETRKFEVSRNVKRRGYPKIKDEERECIKEETLSEMSDDVVYGSLHDLDNYLKEKGLGNIEIRTYGRSNGHWVIKERDGAGELDWKQMKAREQDRGKERELFDEFIDYRIDEKVLKRIEKEENEKNLYEIVDEYDIKDIVKIEGLTDKARDFVNYWDFKIHENEKGLKENMEEDRYNSFLKDKEFTDLYKVKEINCFSYGRDIIGEKEFNKILKEMKKEDYEGIRGAIERKVKDKDGYYLERYGNGKGAGKGNITKERWKMGGDFDMYSAEYFLRKWDRSGIANGQENKNEKENKKSKGGRK